MKKISLVLCFALLMVAMLALGVFAATYENIADDARIELHDSNKTYADDKALIDGDYSTACSAGDGPASWINYKFHYDADKFPKGVTVSSVRVIFDSTGTISNVGTYTELLNKNFTIHLRLYDINGNASYLNQKWNSINGDKNIIKAQYAEDGETVLYRYLEYVFAEPVSGVYQVEVPVENGKDKEIAVWEVEIYNYICPDEEHDWVGQLCGERCDFCGVYKNTELECVPEADDGDCRTAILCQYCDSVLVPSKKHVFAVGSTVCSNDGCVFEGKNITSTTTITPANHTGNAYTAGNGEYIMWWYNTAYIFDGNYSSAANSNYYGTYKFGFELKNPAKLSEIFIVSNASGYNAGTSFNNFNENLEITVTLYDAEGTAIKTTVYQSRNFEDPNVVPIYSANGSMTAVAYKLDTNYATAKKVEVVIKGGVFEVEIYQHVTCDYKHIETKAPTCTADGYELYACDCGESYTVKTGDKLGHSWNEGEVIKEATDLEEGELLQTCNTCGEPRTLAIPTTNHEHDYNTFVETKLAPTCAVPGKDIYVCRCGETAEVVTSATGEHAYTVFVDYTQAPTYLKDGAADYKCETCDATENRVVGRLIMNTAKYAIPTKTYGGWTVCVDYINDGNYNLGSAGTHGEYNGWSFDLDYGENYYFDKMTFVVNSVGKFPSDDAFNFETKTNNSYYFTVTLTDIEGNVVYSEQLNTGLSVEMTGIDANGQEFLYDIVIIEFPEALVASKMSVYCHTGNNNKLGMWEVESFGLPVNYHEDHTYTVLVNPITAATCTTDGLGLYRCNRCEETAEAAIPATGHTWVAATCVAPKTCTVCAATEGDATGVHNYEEDERVDATTSAAGYIIYGCTTCEATYTETLPKLEATIYHVSTWDEFVKAVDGGANASNPTNTYVTVNGETVYIQDGDIIRLDADITGNASIYVRKNITIDLAGYTLRTKGTSGSQLMMMNGSLISSTAQKGTLVHEGVNNVLRIYGNVTEIRNVIILSDNANTNKAAGISVLVSGNANFGTGYVANISDVIIANADGRTSLKVGFELVGTVATISNVTVNNAGEAALWMNGGTCNSISDSTFNGTVGVLFAKTSSATLTNCTVTGTEAAVKVKRDKDTTTKITVNFTANNTTLTATNGIVVINEDTEKATVATFAVPGFKVEGDKVVCDGEHNNSITTVVDPTCEEKGYTYYTCSACGAVSIDEDSYVDALNHDYVQTDRVEPAPGVDGYIEYTCNNCNGTTRESLCAHDLKVVDSKEATCGAAGYKSFECTKCDYAYTETIAALKHNYTETRVEPTGTGKENAGSVTFTCANCGDTSTYDVELFEFDSISTFVAAYALADEYDIIRMTANTTVVQFNTDGANSSYAAIAKAITIDLNGKILTTSGGSSGIMLGGGASMINGTIIHMGGTSAMKTFNVDKLENLNIIVYADYATSKDPVGGISTRNASSSSNYPKAAGEAHINVMRNVKIIGAGNYALEVFNHGLATNDNIIDLIENCYFDAYTSGIDMYRGASIGLIKNSVIYGGTNAIRVQKQSDNYNVHIAFEGNNQIVGGTNALNISYTTTGNGTVKLIADKYTTFSGKFALSISTANASVIDLVGYTANGNTVTECQHNKVLGNCTTETYCSTCGKVFGYEHAGWTENAEKRVAATCVTLGNAYYNCTACGAEKMELVACDANNHVMGIVKDSRVEPTCTTDGSEQYRCWFYACRKFVDTDTTETRVIPATGHTAGTPVVENNVAPDCDTAGSYDNVVYCTVCDAEISRTPVTVDALGHKYVAGTPAADGSVTYTCENGCGASYVVNNTKISGTYYIESMDMFNATFNNGTLTIVDNVMGMSGTYAYEYVVGTYTVTVIDESFSFVLDKGGNVAVLTLATGRQHGLAKYVPAVDAVLGTNTTIAGDIKFVFTAAEDGKYTITANGMMIIIEGIYGADVYNDSFEANLVAGVPFEFYISSNAEAQFEIALVPAHVCSYVETSRTDSTCTTAGSVTYTCSCGESYTEEIKALGHTEVAVAVVPAYKVDGVYHAGTTSGTKCTVCDYTTVVAIDETFQFKAVSLNLSADINAVYKAQVPSDYENVYVVFEMNGKAVDVTEYTIESSTKRFCFKYLGIKAAYLADNVSATIYATVDGKIAAYSYPTYSVKAYCASRIATLAKSNTASANNERTMLSDLLMLGEKVQIDANYKTDNLATSGVEYLTPSAYNGVSSADNIYGATGTKDARVDWKSAALRVGNDLAIRFKVYIAPEHIEHVTFKVVIDRSDLGLENVVYDYNVVEDNLEYIPSEDRYVVSVDKLKASEYGCKVIGTIYYDGVQVGRTINYSVNSYAYTKLNGASATLTTEQEMIKAIYNYGKSARKYVGIK